MKKFLVLCLCLSILAGTFAVGSFAADTQINGNSTMADIFDAYGDNLVTHWDFNSDNVTVSESDNKITVADVAEKGKSSDALTSDANNDLSKLSYSAADGCVTATTDSNKWGSLVASATYTDENEEVQNGDLYSLRNKTLVFKYKKVLTSTSGSNSNVFVKKGAALLAANHSNNVADFRIYSTGSSSIRTKNTAKNVIPNDTVLYIMVSFGYDEVSHMVYAYVYTADESGENIERIYKSSVYTETTSLESTEDFVIGHTAKNRRYDISYYDVRIYDSQIVLEDKAEAHYYGAQTAGYTGEADGVETDLFDVRFIATMDDINAQEIGFNVAVKYGADEKGDFSGSCKYLMSTINASSVGGGLVSNTSDDLGGVYIFALTISEIPQSLIKDGGSVTFTVTPYTIDSNGNRPAAETVQVTVTYDASLADPFVVTSAAA
ncbi:MAG: hypothetical protein IJ038_03435 [Clostridia bacterium]|nr:hypothetical protein [Clostridia bacterium]